jgi:phage/plasmid primase-like uncharacterized protein
MRWKSKGYVLDATQRAEMEAEAAEKLRDRAAEQERLHEAPAERVARHITVLVPATEPAAYMKAKGIRPEPGVFTDLRTRTFTSRQPRRGQAMNDTVHTGNGTKRFAKNSRNEGCFHVVGKIKALIKSLFW